MVWLRHATCLEPDSLCDRSREPVKELSAAPADALVREVAEYPNSFGPLGPHDERIETPRFTLCMGAGSTWNTVQRQRFEASELDEVLEEVRSLLRARRRTRTQWEIGSQASPTDLVPLLLQRGLVRDREPYAVALVLRAEPPTGPPELEARRVRTLEEFMTASAVQREAFGMPEDEAAERDRLLDQVWRESPNFLHAVWKDGVIVAAGTSAPTPHGLLLYGGATLPSARGQGAYRALLRARWDDAVSLGTPALFTQAGAMSRPILERLGFQRVGHIHLLVDDFGDGGRLDGPRRKGAGGEGASPEG
jgi:GNAT superfamily N-acetyltransferase